MKEKTEIAPLLKYVDKAVEKLNIDRIVYVRLKKNLSKWHTPATTYGVRGKPNACLVEIAPELIGHLSPKEWEYLFAHEVLHSLPGCKYHSRQFFKRLDEAYPPKAWQNIQESIDKSEEDLGPDTQTRTRWIKMRA